MQPVSEEVLQLCDPIVSSVPDISPNFEVAANILLENWPRNKLTMSTNEQFDSAANKYRYLVRNIQQYL